MNAAHQLRNFGRALNAFSGEGSLARFLKEFFRQNRQMGSSDRRNVSQLLYTFFRLGKAAAGLPDEQRLAIALFLASSQPNAVLAELDAARNELVTLPLAEKLRLVENENSVLLDDVFPFGDHLSKGVDRTAFFASHFTQPDLFIRPHPGKAAKVRAVLSAAGLLFSEEDGAIRLPNATRLEQLFPTDRPFDVQDLSSQQTGTFFQPARWEKWWDACAGSGGKSLLLAAQQPELSLVVSDIRETILENLDERFRSAGVNKYQKKLLDLTENADPVLHDYAFDGIILDAPCTGSGTWGRSPELIRSFNDSTIANFQGLQKSILRNVVPYLKPGKPLIYITCSVFAKENEEITDHLVTAHGFTLERQEILKGYERRADTMFVARMLKA